MDTSDRKQEANDNLLCFQTQYQTPILILRKIRMKSLHSNPMSLLGHICS